MVYRIPNYSSSWFHYSICLHFLLFAGLFIINLHIFYEFVNFFVMQNLSLPDFIPNVTFLKGIPRPCSASRQEKTCAMHARLCAICWRTDRVRCTYRIYLLTSKKQFYILFIPFISVFYFSSVLFLFSENIYTISPF